MPGYKTSTKHLKAGLFIKVTTGVVVFQASLKYYFAALQVRWQALHLLEIYVSEG